MGVMDVAQLETLEHQLHHLRRIQDRLGSTERVHPGTSTFWSGTARDKYEEMVLRLDAALASTDHALREAIDATARAILGPSRG